MVGYESQLEELALTVSTIQADLLDAELRQQKLTDAGRDYIEKLKDAVYDFDDVLDEFNTRALQKAKVDDNIFEKVRCFFSTSNQLLIAYNMSHEIKKTKEKLDSIAKNRREFGFRDVYEPPKKRNETGSYVAEFSVIGREADTKTIVGLLLGESDYQFQDQENVAYVTIVGMGGLGKTTLAQLVYNDVRITDAFDVTKWVCVSNDFGMEQILAKMTGRNVGCGMEELQREARNMIEKMKYLLVLDDIWDDNRNKWNELQDFLMLGGNGSRVLTTTRSKAVAGAIENNYTYELHGLSVEDSLLLFERKAFGKKGKATVDDDLVNIGKEVVEKCANVPLSIGVLGSLLYGQPKSKWLSFRNIDLSQLGSGKDGVMPILKYSYYDLSPSLKSCFSYCALFPKDFQIVKRKLVWLWMAHGCLDAEKDGRTMEGLGDDYFSILVNRCFFQEVEEDEYGEISYYKMHDLIHDLALEVAGKESFALEVAGKESFALETSMFQPDRKLRHLSIVSNGSELFRNSSNWLGKMKKLRTLLYNFDYKYFPIGNEPSVNVICSNLRRLRVLDLSLLGLKSLPNTLGNLSHLRYLDLSNNDELEILPESITKLQNLLVLNLNRSHVRELPKGLRNLCNLRHLDLAHCEKLTHMPVGMDSMVNLETLSMFVVAGDTSKQVTTGHLKDLRSLVHLSGTLEIVFRNGFSYDLADAKEVDCLLSDKVRLNELILRWEDDDSNEHGLEGIHDILLEGLRPHSNIKGIVIEGFKGVKLTSWVGSLAVSFPLLVSVSLDGLKCLINLPLLGQLLHLKILQLSSLPNIKFIGCDEDASSSVMSTVSDELKFFPSLESLTLINLPKLKEIRTDRKSAVVQSFLRLKELQIEDCACLTVVPWSPSLRHLRLTRLHKDFRFGSINNDSMVHLKLLIIDNVALVNSLFGVSLEGIDSLCINGFRQEMLSKTAVLFQRHASSIRSLTLDGCNELESLFGGGIEHLTNLTDLYFENSSDVDLGEGDNCVTSPWKSPPNLSELSLWSLSYLKYLPQGFRHLTSLRTLRIYDCSLESLPEWLPNLTSLRELSLRECNQLMELPEAISRMPALISLEVLDCKHLTDRCRENDGQDWPKIRHIKYLNISKAFVDPEFFMCLSGMLEQCCSFAVYH